MSAISAQTLVSPHTSTRSILRPVCAPPRASAHKRPCVSPCRLSQHVSLCSFRRLSVLVRVALKLHSSVGLSRTRPSVARFHRTRSSAALCRHTRTKPCHKRRSSAVQASTRPSVSPFTVPFTRNTQDQASYDRTAQERLKRCSAPLHTIRRCPPQPHKIKPSATQAQASLKPCTCAARTCPSLEHTCPCTQDRRNRSHGTTTTTCECVRVRVCVCVCVRVCECVCVSACV